MTRRQPDASALVAEVDALVSAPNALDAPAGGRILDLLTALEAATPGGAPLHHQIDVVRRWVGVLWNEPEHARFGGVAHLREYVAGQLRLLRMAVEDYAQHAESGGSGGFDPARPLSPGA